MFTAARLIGAIYFAGLGFYLSSIVIPLLPQQGGLGHFTNINVAAGLVVGWVILGPRAKGTFRNALGAGLTTAVAGFLVALFAHAGVEMVDLALRKRYESAVEAVIGVIEEAWKFFMIVATVEVVATLLIGGMVGGLIARSAAARWR